LVYNGDLAEREISLVKEGFTAILPNHSKRQEQIVKRKCSGNIRMYSIE
jgi:hypothetical protein